MLALALGGGAALALHHGLAAPPAARAALLVFGLALLAWTLLRWAETPVALAAALALVALGVVPAETLYASLGHSLIWLLLGAYLLAAVLVESGLAERWALRAVAGAATPAQLLMRLTCFAAATAFVVPSTSGRAALLLPVFLVLAKALNDARLTRAMALLFPSVILLSACASLLGAGAHLVAVDMMKRLGLGAPTLLTWAAWTLPIAVGSCVAAAFLVLQLFLTADERRRPIVLPAAPRAPLTSVQKRVGALVVLTLLAWAASGWLGIDAALIALAAGLLATQKQLSGVSLKAALKRVEWNLILFLAATLVLGRALIDSGAAQALTQALLHAWPVATWSAPAVLLLASVVALLSHLVVTSRTARALVLLPVLAMPLAAGGVNPALLILLLVVGSGFCQTLVVSAKPVAIFVRAELPAGLALPSAMLDHALLGLSLALLPVMAALLMGCALLWWPWLGLA